MNPILRALNAGYTPTQVLQFVSKLMEGKQQKGSKRNARDIEPLAETQQQGHMFTDRERAEKGSQLLKTGLKGAALVAGIPAAMASVPRAVASISGVLGGSNPAPGGPGNVPNAPGPLGGAPPTPPPAASSMTAPQTPPAAQILQQMGLLPHVHSLQEAGNAPETIGHVIKGIVKGPQKDWLKTQTPQGIDEVVKEYLASEPQHPEQPHTEEKTPPTAESEHRPQRLAALPSGEVGPIVEEKQGIATIELPDGKKRRQKIEDIHQEDPDFEKQVMGLIQAIPEDERSAVVAFASYNPESEIKIGGKETTSPWMGVQFHNGDLYLYPDVSREQYERVVSKTVPAKTSGENPWHAWVKGKESRGAGMYEIIKELESEFGKNFVKLEAKHGYDYFKRLRETVKKVQRRKRTP